ASSASLSPPASPHPTARTVAQTGPASAMRDNCPSFWLSPHPAIAAPPSPAPRFFAAAATSASSVAIPPPPRGQTPRVPADARSLECALSVSRLVVRPRATPQAPFVPTTSAPQTRTPPST